MNVLEFRERGRGDPLVLLHGFPFDGRMWDAQLDGLSARFRVIVPDLPGFGRSQPPRPFTVASAAAEVRALLADLDALPCILGGLSMGGYTALEFAHQFPADLAGLLLVDTRCDADTPEGQENRNRMIQIALEKGAGPIADVMEPKLLPPTADPDLRRRLREMMLATPPRTIAHCLAALRDRADSTPRLAAIEVPTLVVVGELDGITPPSVAQVMVEGIAGARLAVIAGAGHMTPMEQAGEVNRIVEEFGGWIR
jgi:3-oxoadipate enol-lactonase